LSVGHLTQTKSLRYACLIIDYRAAGKSYGVARKYFSLHTSLYWKLFRIRVSETVENPRLTLRKGVR